MLGPNGDCGGGGNSEIPLWSFLGKILTMLYFSYFYNNNEVCVLAFHIFLILENLYIIKGACPQNIRYPPL